MPALPRVNRVHRLIGDALLRGHPAPVVVLEGPRGVGKTTLMREQVASQGYSYSSLADDGTRSFAKADPANWVRTLTLPAIIDEAQLVDSLPLAIKEYVDTLTGGTSFVLTGSASIGRTGLGGADPLTRRSRRTTMWPLTAWELAGQPGSVVDLLFDGDPVLGFADAGGDEKLTRELTLGGFPGTRFPSGRYSFAPTWPYEAVRADVAALLSNEVLPGAKADSSAAHTLLDGLLRTPGGILNMSAAAVRVGVNPRTADRLFSVFERVFLLHWLPNRATSASRQGYARSKVHAVDTSFAVESLRRAGITIPDDREVFGAVLETYVVNQMVASATWARVPTTAFYWRDAKTQHEVDLVLEDDRGRRIGVEVKASRAVHPHDLDGLRALRKKLGLHRGFVVHTGTELRQLEAEIWALPMSALADASAFAPLPSIDLTQEVEPIMVTNPSQARNPTDADATVFLSYVRADDKHLDGNIVRFAEDVIEHYEYLTGHALRLIWDRNDVLWGDLWRDRLEAFADTTTFLMAAVTPRFLKSEACRKEVLDFLAAARRSGEPKLLLPVAWVGVDQTDVVAETDPVLQAINETQQLRIASLGSLTPGTPDWKAAVDQAATALQKTIAHRASGPTETLTNPDDDPGLLEAVSNPDFAAATDDLKAALEAIGTVFSAAPAAPNQPKAAAAWLATIGQKLKRPVTDLDGATDRLGEAWRSIDQAITQLVTATNLSRDDDLHDTLTSALVGLRQALELPGADVIAGQLQTISAVSRHLRPMSKSVSASVRLITGIRSAVDGWLDQLK